MHVSVPFILSLRDFMFADGYTQWLLTVSCNEIGVPLSLGQGGLDQPWDFFLHIYQPDSGWLRVEELAFPLKQGYLFFLTQPLLTRNTTEKQMSISTTVEPN